MTLQIAVLLGQDGVVNGAIYALLALSIVLVFSVTRVLLIPQGEFVSYGALTMAALENGQRTAVVWLLAGLCAAVAALDAAAALRRRAAGLPLPRGVGLRLLSKPAYAAAMVACVLHLPLADLPMAARIGLTLALVVPMGPLSYRLVFQPIADAPALVLLIVSIALHVSMLGLALLIFGAEGAHTRPLVDAVVEWGGIRINAQTLVVVGAALGLIGALAFGFGRTLAGKALRAAAVDRLGARLMGISPEAAGRATFTLAAAIGALSGVLIAPVTTLYYDSGFLISLKGFVGAIVGGLASYPLAAAGALLVGLIEAYGAFWSSAYKEIIVFTLIIPVLLWRSLSSRTVEETE